MLGEGQEREIPAFQRLSKRHIPRMGEALIVDQNKVRHSLAGNIDIAPIGHPIEHHDKLLACAGAIGGKAAEPVGVVDRNHLVARLAEVERHQGRLQPMGHGRGGQGRGARQTGHGPSSVLRPKDWGLIRGPCKALQRRRAGETLR